MQKSTYLRTCTIVAVLAFCGISSATAGTIAAERWTKNDGLWSEHLGSYFTPETRDSGQPARPRRHQAPFELCGQRPHPQSFHLLMRRLPVHTLTRLTFALLLASSLSLCAHADHIKSDGNGGFFTSDDHIRSDGNGGYFTSDGHIRSDGNGGFFTPDGHIRSDGNGGFFTPDGHIRSDGNGGFFTSDGHIRSDGNGGLYTP